MKLWSSLENILNDEKEKIRPLIVQDLEEIPLESDMSLEVGKWYRIRNVVSLYIDMKSSTQLTNERYIKASAKIYQIFTGSLIQILREFDSQFIDIKGDGGFALWKERFSSVKALLAAVTFKTLVQKYLKDFVKNQITNWEILSKIGIAKGNVLVKRIGTRNTPQQKFNWAVWVGKPVNISYKLSDKSVGDTVLATDDVFQDFSKPKNLYNYLVLSCGCPQNKKVNLWEEKPELEREYLIKIWELKSRWCDIHGEEYLNKSLEIIKIEENK